MVVASCSRVLLQPVVLCALTNLASKSVAAGSTEDPAALTEGLIPGNVSIFHFIPAEEWTSLLGSSSILIECPYSTNLTPTQY